MLVCPSLISLSGRNIGNINQLSWKVTNEQNLDYYELQSSIDGHNFNYISEIKAVGNTHYTYNDNIAALTNPVYFYRLNTFGY